MTTREAEQAVERDRTALMREFYAFLAGKEQQAKEQRLPLCAVMLEFHENNFQPTLYTFGLGGVTPRHELSIVASAINALSSYAIDLNARAGN